MPRIRSFRTSPLGNAPTRCLSSAPGLIAPAALASRSFQSAGQESSHVSTWGLFASEIEPTGIPASRLASRSMLPTGIEPTGTPAIDRPTTVFEPVTPLQLPPAVVIAPHQVEESGGGSWLSVARPSRNAENGTPFRIDDIRPLSGSISALNRVRV